MCLHDILAYERLRSLIAGYSMQGNQLNIVLFFIYSLVFTSGCQERKVCPDDMSACWMECVDLMSDGENCGVCDIECRTDQECIDGACHCLPYLTYCGGICVDTLTDPENCGICGIACDSGEQCVNGVCRCGGTGVDCGAGETCCLGSCVDVDSDDSHCGSCGNECGPGESCVTGRCRCGTGPECDDSKVCCLDYCVDVRTDGDNCGSCSTACDVGETCVSGVCRCGGSGPDCSGGDICCGSTCHDLMTDEEHCGNCATVCDQNEMCVSGDCMCGGTGPDCTGSDACCGTECVDLNTDLGNCGSCGNFCDLHEAVGGCVDGICVIEQCNSSFRDCDLVPENGCEADILTDPENCGLCTVRCDEGEQCAGGECRCGGIGPECFDENICCGAACVNPFNDEHNCGSCGIACGAGELCVGGECRCGGIGPVCGVDQVCCCTECVDRNGNQDPCEGCSPSCGMGEECICGYCVNIEWIPIPGGAFMMGSPEGVGEDDEHPRHQVSVPDFEMLRSEVTVSQYQYCVDSGVCIEPYSPGDCGTWCDRCNWGVPGRDDYPVVCIDWHQAVDFCIWAVGRLPTEAEWEYAARSGGQDIAYPWGDQQATCEYAVMSDQFGGGYGCGLWHEWPVCSKPAGNTSQGLCDMAGNVWEMVQDYWHYDYISAPSDGSAWEDPSSHARVRRGGAWDYMADSLRAVERKEGGGFVDNTGFRCARNVVP